MVECRDAELGASAVVGLEIGSGEVDAAALQMESARRLPISFPPEGDSAAWLPYDGADA